MAYHKVQSSKLKVQCYRLSRKALVTLNDPSAIFAQKSKYCCALVSFRGTSLMMRKEIREKMHSPQMAAAPVWAAYSYNNPAESHIPHESDLRTAYD